MDRVSGSSPQRTQYQAEQRTSEVPRQNVEARSYARLSPEQQRSESIARKPKAAVKTLGSRIDVYA